MTLFGCVYGQKRERGREDALHVQRSGSLPLLVAAYSTAAFSRRSNSGIGYNVNGSTTTIQSTPYTRKSKSQIRNRECAYDLGVEMHEYNIRMEVINDNTHRTNRLVTQQSPQQRRSDRQPSTASLSRSSALLGTSSCTDNTLLRAQRSQRSSLQSKKISQDSQRRAC